AGVASTVPEAPDVGVYPDGLTAREVDVLRLLAAGLTNKQIAQRLVMSPHTVNIHVQSIYSKVDVHTRSAATHYAMTHGLM
ncbi:MAG TPA: LuxR C-terminal-related transcriptional regulator, partial [Ktedonobacterales bacterium]|nr:LuxR C-terminal-related transcriptional regulator [Ktedonobacterales bacterium]